MKIEYYEGGLINEEQVIGAYLDDLNERNVIKRKSLYGQFVLNWFEELIRGI